MRRTIIFGLTLALVGTVATARAADTAAEKEVTVTGEVVDTFCYSAMGARGASHHQCGVECAKKGVPVGLAEKGSDKLYVLLPSKDKQPVPQGVVDKMGDTVTITGHAYAKGGSNFLTVDAVK